MARTPQEIARDHGQALVGGDLDAIVSDYTEDAIFISPDGVLRGRDGVRDGFAKLLRDVPDARWEVSTQHFADDILLLEWRAESDTVVAEHGVDTFVFRDGLIRVQTIRYTLRPK